MNGSCWEAVRKGLFEGIEINRSIYRLHANSAWDILRSLGWCCTRNTHTHQRWCPSRKRLRQKRFPFQVKLQVNPTVAFRDPGIDTIRSKSRLTDKLYCLLEVGADVSHVAVLHWDPLVVIVAFCWLHVSAGHVEQGRDVKVAEIVLSGGVVGTTEVEERQDLDGFTLKVEKIYMWVHVKMHLLHPEKLN